MTSHPPEPPAQWPPPSPGERPGRGAPRPGAPEERPGGPHQRYPGDQPGNGRRAAAASPPASGVPPPLADYPPATHRPQAGHPAGAGPGPGGHPDHPDYPDLPDYPPETYSPRDTYTPGYPSMPDYPPTPDYPPAPGGQPAGYRPSGYPASAYPASGHPPGAYPGAGQGGHRAGRSPAVEFPAAPVTHEEYLHPDGVPAVGPGALRALPAPAAGSRAAGWAVLGYLTVPLAGFVVPLAIYLASVRRSRWLRAHAAQAVNVWLTAILYCLSAAIIGAMLVLDSPRVALAVVLPLVAVLWLTTLGFLVRAAAAARRGEAYTFPRWLCTRMVR